MDTPTQTPKGPVRRTTSDVSSKSESEAKLSMVSLKRAILPKASLCGAYLEFANNLTQAALDVACGDNKLILPQGLTINNCVEK